MLHKFQVEETGTVFYYDNHISGLLDRNGNHLSKPHSYPEAYLDFIHARNADKEKPILKSNQPAMVKIILGHRCNFSCGYCMQDELSSKCGDDTRAKEKEKAKTLKDKMLENLDLSHLSRIELWGGEAFLYWHEVTALMEAFDRDGMTFYIPTNGSLIDERHIEFFKTLKATVCLGISHDGPSHTITRGPDFLEKSVEVFRALQAAHPKIQFCFKPVISNANYDLFAINDFFRGFLQKHGLKNVPLMYEIIQVYSLEEVRGNSRSFALLGDDLEKYRGILASYLEAHRQQVKTLPREELGHGPLLITNLYELYAGAMTFAKELGTQEVMHSGTKCQADQERQLSIDMDGNVRTCQNVGREAIFGNITDLKNVQVTNIDTNQGPHCGSCRVRFLCKSQCPIKQHPDVFETNCRINKVHYGAIQDAAFNYLFNGTVTYLGRETNG